MIDTGERINSNFHFQFSYFHSSITFPSRPELRSVQNSDIHSNPRRSVSKTKRRAINETKLSINHRQIATVQNSPALILPRLTPPDPTLTKKHRKQALQSTTTVPHPFIVSPADQKRSTRQKPQMTSCAPQRLAQNLVSDAAE
jgi:hypothetical protein